MHATTIGHRSALVLALTFLAVPASAQTATLPELLSRLDADPQLRTMADSAVSEQHKRALLASRLDGPAFDVGSRFVPAGEHEFEVVVAQEFVLGPKRSHERASAEAMASALTEDGRDAMVALKGALASQFHRALHARRRVETLENSHKQVARAHESLVLRNKAGDASAFDVDRMARELRHLQRRIEHEQIRYREAVSWVATIVADANLHEVEGRIQPQNCGGTPPESPELVGLTHRVSAASSAVDAARASGLPSFSLALGGAGIVADGDLLPGVVTGVGLRWPFWSGRNHAIEAAQAAHAGAIAKHDRRTRAIHQQADALARRCDDWLSLARKAADDVEQTRALVVRAEAGYAAAELSLLELVDAHGALMEDELTHLELQANARQAQDDWLTATGGW